LLAARRFAFTFFLDTPQCARACGVFLWLATALILSFSSTFLL